MANLTSRPSRALRTALLGMSLVGFAASAAFFLPLWSAKASFLAPSPLTAIMRPAPQGWAVTERPVGATELETTKAEELLRYDDAFVRTYKKDDLEVVVYVAYWLPGKMDPRMVLGHTPDACWIYDGASMIARNDRRVLPGAGAHTLIPGYFRIFDWSGQKMEVVFWHILGGKPSGLSPEEATADNGPVQGPLAMLKSAFASTGFGTVRRDQVFVRISTNQSIDAIVHSDLWPVLVASLGPTGIAPAGS